MKNLAFIVILSMTMFFIVGGITAYFGLVDINTYALVAGICGSIASILGLISFVKPGLKAADLKQVGAELVNEIAVANSQVNLLENEIKRSKDEILQLELKKAEMELLVRKAVTKIYFEERLKAVDKEIMDHIEGDGKLLDMIKIHVDLNNSAKEIGEEISGSNNEEIINHIVRVHQSVHRDRDSYNIHYPPYFSALDALTDIMKTVLRTVNRM